MCSNWEAIKRSSLPRHRNATCAMLALASFLRWVTQGSAAEARTANHGYCPEAASAQSDVDHLACHPAVNNEVLARDEAALAAGQVLGKLRDVIHRTNAANWVL